MVTFFWVNIWAVASWTYVVYVGYYIILFHRDADNLWWESLIANQLYTKNGTGIFPCWQFKYWKSEDRLDGEGQKTVKIKCLADQIQAIRDIRSLQPIGSTYALAFTTKITRIYVNIYHSHGSYGQYKYSEIN